MNVLLCFIFFICMVEIVTIFGQTGPGKTSCFYFPNTCTDIPAVNVNKLPEMCSSFFTESLEVQGDYSIGTPAVNYDFLRTLGKSGKNLYMKFNHANFSLLTETLDCSTESTCYLKETDKINDFMKIHPGITGLSISGLDTSEMSGEFPGFNNKLINYIKLMKQETQLDISLFLNGQSFNDYFYNNPQFVWLNFPSINSHVSFYVISLLKFNADCTEDLRNTGIAPIKGNAINTLDKLKIALLNAGIPKEKLFFLHSLQPEWPSKIENLCDVNYQRLCTQPDFANDWCADTQNSLYEKGHWFDVNVAGFIGHNLNLDDTENQCHCGPFPAFNAILAGMKGSTPPAKCPLFDNRP